LTGFEAFDTVFLPSERNGKERISLWNNFRISEGKKSETRGKSSSEYVLLFIFLVLGSMFWSQFSAIFVNFRRKNGGFLSNQCYDKMFAKLAVVWAKTPNFSTKIFLKS
jgi:hypothetical protein